MDSPKDTRYLFIDMNSFFASCEQEKNISYRHKPLVVTPVNVASGCVIAASYEAKAYGIKTGTLVRQAREILPQVIVCESNVNLYLDFHHKLVKILGQFSPFIKILSVDEAVIKLSPSEQNSARALTIARAIKEKIREKMGKYLRSSVGIGPNIWLAKMAAESEKPDGLVEVRINSLSSFLEKLKLTDFTGINSRLEKRLNYLNIFKPMDLYLASAEELRKKMGIVGEYWYFRLHGYEMDEQRAEIPKSIGHSHILEPSLRSWSKAWAVCQKLAERAGRRLRADKLVAGGACLWIRYLGQKGWHQYLKTPQFSDSQTFLKYILILWDQAPKDARPLGLGVRMVNLSYQAGFQQSIFSLEQRLISLYQAVDKINDRYGSFTIKPANILPVESSAPRRIAFGPVESL
ncbi:MAG: hypothetical protein M1338_03160 [Patescibacteria group bacterium]|nr:hypothetical protein [Patescibacteria group bacterium]